MSALTIKQWNGQAVDVRQKLRSEWSKLCEKDGFLFSKKFLTLLTNAGYRRPNQMKRPGSASRQPDSFKPTEMDVEFALKQMGLSPYHIHDGVFLRYTTVENWYLGEVLGERGDLRNILLCRHAIGIPKFGYHRLPPPNSVYGEVTKDTGDRIWDLMHNKFAKPVEQGIGAMGRANFPADAAHPKPSRYRPASAFNPDVRFGNPSARPTPIADLINNKFAIEGLPGTELAPERTYAPDEGKKLAGRLPLPRGTRSSDALAAANTQRFSHLEVHGHAAFHATHVQRSVRPRPQTARL